MTVIPTASQQVQRAVYGQPFTLSYTWGLNDEALPDDASVAVAVVDADGNSVAAGSVTLSETDSGQRTATSVIAGAALVGRTRLTVTWSYTVSSGATHLAVTSTVDVCDARLFALADYGQYPEIARKGFTDAQLEQARFEAEARLEWECGCAFTGRYGTQHVVIPSVRSRWDWDDRIGSAHHVGPTSVTLEKPFVLSLRGISRHWVNPADGTFGDEALDLDYARLDTHTSTVHYHGPHGEGLYGDLTFAFDHGKPVPDLRRICALLAKHRLLSGPIDDRATSLTTENGGLISLLTPGLGGIGFGIPEIDAFVERHDQHVMGYLGGSF